LIIYNPIGIIHSPFHNLAATRAPTRPNLIGISVVRLTRIERNIMHVDHLEILDGTPLLDIKPYLPEFDFQPEVRTGWLEQAKGKVKRTVSDDRFKS
jgi:tRNA (Thr-GGU) A37 N-methylase